MEDWNPEVLKDILKTGDSAIERMIKEKYKLEDEKEKDEESSVQLLTAYRNIQDILRKYCDLREDYYNLISLWIVGTYFHNNFPTYPYLQIWAMKSSGKSRLLRLVITLSKEGSLLNSLTEAVLFRTTGTLGIDEFEGMSRKGNETLKELLNSAYKKGIMVKRMRKVKSIEGEKQVVEEFSVYRPIVIANIGGIEPVLGDRCLTLVIDKSDKPLTGLIEMFETEKLVISAKNLLTNLGNTPNQCSLCSVVSLGNVYTGWNDYLINYTNYINTTNNINYTNYIELYQKIKEVGILGRELELTFPLFIIAEKIGVLEQTLKECKNLIDEKKQEDAIESTDVSLIEFVSQEKGGFFIRINELTQMFREFLQSNEEWINDKWIGRALKRLNLIKEKKRMGRGVEVILDITKAQEKIKMFK